VLRHYYISILIVQSPAYKKSPLKHEVVVVALYLLNKMVMEVVGFRACSAAIRNRKIIGAVPDNIIPTGSWFLLGS